MHLYFALMGACAGLSAANPHPWMYGVPDYPDLGMEEVMTEAANEFMAEWEAMSRPDPNSIGAAADSVVAAAGSTDEVASGAAPAAPSPTYVVIAEDGNNKTQAAETPARKGPEPCAAINKAISMAPPGARKVVPAELGVMCLQSVPLDTKGNMQLLDDIKLFAKWQSNLAYLKNPPENYTEAPVDIMGELDNMQKGLAAGEFKTEYDFQMNIMSLFNRAYDNHFAYQPDILASAMQFQRPPGSELVAVSSDGMAMPEVFTFQDIRKANVDTSFKPSPVKMINGMDAKDYLMNVSAQSDFHDADTRWNALFPSQPLIASGTTFLGSFRTGQYQGPNTTLQFANGTTFDQMNLAVVFGNFTDVNSGEDFFKRFCTGPQPPPEQPAQSTVEVPTQAAPAPAPSHFGYPQAEIINPNLAIGGYFLNGTNYDDVAVLSIPSYSSDDVQSFQNTMRDFIRLSKAQGKTKMIFDMRGNGGGNAILGYDSFKQVYPQADKEPFGGTRFRANDALNSAGKLTSDFIANKTFAQGNMTAFTEAFGRGTTQNDIFAITAGFNFEHQLDVNNEPFPSWEAAFGPQQFNGDNFTTVGRYNFSDGISTSYQGFDIIGVGKNSNETATPQPFRAQDMVMLHDGMCSSTCAIAAELLKDQGSVRTIAVGGRPQEGPMQGIGGTKGAQVFSWDDIQLRMQATYFLGSPEQRKAWDATDLGKTAFASQLFKRSAYAGGRVAGGVNLKDNLRQNDESGTPLEFVYDAADCRMFFTQEMVSDVTAVWKGVADRMFERPGGAGAQEPMRKCVVGSMGHPSSITAGGLKRVNGTVPFEGAAGRGGIAWSALTVGLVAALAGGM